MHSKVEEYISKKEHWRKELELLRTVFSDLPVDETIKWGAPTYAFNGKNIVGLAAFKNYCGLWFFQGALLRDPYKVFVNAQEGKTKAMLQWRFYAIDEINVSQVKEYVIEAIENIKLGKEIKPVRNQKEVSIPIELQKELASNKIINHKFSAFSKSKQREFADYISNAKRVETRLRRMQKIIPLILEEKGLYDKYKNC